MNYYSFHVGDYAVHTIHLSDEEDLIYRRLIDLYYQTERPITTDVDRAARLIRKSGQVALVESVLSEFFQKTETGYTNKRCEAEITKYHAKADRAKAANDKRWSGHVLKSDQKSETISAPNQEPRTNNQEPKTKSKPKTNAPAFDAVAALSGLGVEKGLSEEWLSVRRKKGATAVTQRVIDGVIREAGLASVTVEQAIAKCCERGWQTFDHTYVPSKAPTQFKSEKQRNMEASMRAIYGPKVPAQTEKLITGEIV